MSFYFDLFEGIKVWQKVDTTTNTVKMEYEPIERRYNDFVWLRKRLVKSYRGYVVPPIPEKGLVSMSHLFILVFIDPRVRTLREIIRA